MYIMSADGIFDENGWMRGIRTFHFPEGKPARGMPKNFFTQAVRFPYPLKSDDERIEFIDMLDEGIDIEYLQKSDTLSVA